MVRGQAKQHSDDLEWAGTSPHRRDLTSWCQLKGFLRSESARQRAASTLTNVVVQLLITSRAVTASAKRPPSNAHAGVAVTFVMFMTTMIMTLAILVVWGHNVLLALAFFLVFGLIDASFLTAALSKFTHGGWFPIALSGR